MAALYGKGIDNLLIEIDAEEVPILDGSSKNFVEAISLADFEISDQPIKIITIDKEVVYKEGEKSISFKPSKISLEIDFEINFKSLNLIRQWGSAFPFAHQAFDPTQIFVGT